MNSFNVQAFVDRQKLKSLHILVLVIACLVMFADGFDVFLVGKIAPVIAESYGVPPKDMTQVFLFQQIGLAIGAFGAAPLADRYGRRAVLSAATLIFGLFTIATAYAPSLLTFAILRGLTGVFLSAGLPMAIALLSETAPKGARGAFIAIALAGYSTGGAAGGAVAAWLIDSYGWQIGFWIGGLLPLVIAPLLWFLAPESLPFLASRDPKDPSIPRTLKRFDRTLVLAGDEHFVAGDGSREAAKARLFDLVKDGRMRTTILIWSACVLGMGNIALLAAWLPTFFKEMAGVPIQVFAVASMISFTGGVIGTLTIGWMMDRLGPARLIPVFYLGLAAVLLLLGRVPFDSPYFVWLLGAWNFFQTGGQAGINTLIAQIYPASARSTALGWAGGAGRIGGIIAPLFGGVALASHLSLQQTLMFIALPPIGVAILIMLIGATKPPAPQTARA